MLKYQLRSETLSSSGVCCESMPKTKTVFLRYDEQWSRLIWLTNYSGIKWMTHGPRMWSSGSRKDRNNSKVLALRQFKRDLIFVTRSKASGASLKKKTKEKAMIPREWERSANGLRNERNYINRLIVTDTKPLDLPVSGHLIVFAWVNRTRLN